MTGQAREEEEEALTSIILQVYIGVTLDRTFSFKAHIENTKKKVGTRNNIVPN